MAAVVIAIHTLRIKEKSILTSRAVFANQLPRIGVVNGNSGSTGCVLRGREEYAIILSFFFVHLWFFLSRYRLVFTLSASLNALSVGNGIWPFSFFYDCFFVKILACFHLVGAMCALSVGNGICPLSFLITYSALHIRH